MKEVPSSHIAVSAKEMNEFGCPYCGYRSGISPISDGRTTVWQCGECGKACLALADGVTQSTIGRGGRDRETIYPKLQDHPRRGTPSHGSPDVRPESGGEFFRSRGFGLDFTPGCFICGGAEGMHHNISAFVRCREAGERIVSMFASGAFLDFRKHEPDYVQVKVGACKDHKHRLEELHSLTHEHQGTITPDMIRIASMQA